MKRIGPHPAWMLFSSCLLGAAAAALISLYTDESYFLSFDGTTLRGTDLSYNLIYAKALWLLQGGNIYSVEAQDKILSAFLGAALPSAGVVTWGPAGFLLLFPFALTPTLEIANLCWAAGSVALLAFGIFNYMKRTVLSFHFLMIALLIVVIFSHDFFYALAIGQASILISGVLVLLAGFLLVSDRGELSTDLVGGVCLLLLSLKPPYFLVGAILVCGFYRWRLFGFGVAMIVVTFLAMTPILGGVAWIQSYFEMLALHSSGTYPERYSVGFTHQYRVASFVNALNVFVDRPQAVLASNMLLLGGWGASLSLAYKRFKAARFGDITPGVMACFTYLLFSPYIGGYEEILIILPIFALLTVSTPRLNVRHLPPIAALVILLNFGVSQNALPLGLLWTLKLAFSLWMLSQFPELWPARRHAL